jgi:hypothetical protein
MRNTFVKIIRQGRERLGERAVWILGFEALLFSGVFAVTGTSWMVFWSFLLLFWSGLWFSKGKIVVMLVLCAMWGFFAASLGYGFGQWPWALAFGLGFFLFGVMKHWGELGPELIRKDAFEEGSAVFYPGLNTRWGGEALN